MKLIKILILAIAILVNSAPLYAAPVTAFQGESTTQSKLSTININSADVQALSSLPGIGKSKAMAIIEHRNNIGKFTDISDIKNVKGIGDKLFVKLESKITVK